jgi:hypothetical protein
MIKLCLATALFFTTVFAPTPWLNNLNKAEQLAKTPDLIGAFPV